MNINLSTDATQFIESLVTTGQYPSPDDDVADGVRLLMGQQQLRVEIQQGITELDAGQGLEGEQVFAELRERVKKLTQ